MRMKLLRFSIPSLYKQWEPQNNQADCLTPKGSRYKLGSLDLPMSIRADKHLHWSGLCKKLVCINKLSIQSIQNMCTCILAECQERSPWNHIWIISYLGEIQMKYPQLYYGISVIFLSSLPIPIHSNHVSVQDLELVSLSRRTRSLCQVIQFWGLASFMTIPQESFMRILIWGWKLTALKFWEPENLL